MQHFWTEPSFLSNTSCNATSLYSYKSALNRLGVRDLIMDLDTDKHTASSQLHSILLFMYTVSRWCIKLEGSPMLAPVVAVVICSPANQRTVIIPSPLRSIVNGLEWDLASIRLWYRPQLSWCPTTDADCKHSFCSYIIIPYLVGSNNHEYWNYLQAIIVKWCTRFFEPIQAEFVILAIGIGLLLLPPSNLIFRVYPCQSCIRYFCTLLGETSVDTM